MTPKKKATYNTFLLVEVLNHPIKKKKTDDSNNIATTLHSVHDALSINSSHHNETVDETQQPEESGEIEEVFEMQQQLSPYQMDTIVRIQDNPLFTKKLSPSRDRPDIQVVSYLDEKNEHNLRYNFIANQ